ncbi:MAG TPA: protein kinase [Lachnospiraceae bacterium]|nr:protein kinase [Lachnospiraceae bacterium]
MPQPSYEKLYHSTLKDGKEFSFCKDEKTGKPCVRKVLSVYHIQVYGYLKEHPNRHIPGIYDFREEDGKLIVLEEFIRGETLEYILNTEPELPRTEKIRILIGICDGLSFLHGAKPPIIHRDLKASNIMVAADRTVKIIDYDAAREYRPGETEDTDFIGTFGIAAPEQYGFRQSDARTDIYAVGKLIERMFPGDARMLNLAAKAAEFSPGDRFPDAVFLKQHLENERNAGDTGDECGENTECFCPNCGASLNDQPGFEKNNGTWYCTECGQFLFGDEAGDTGDRLQGVIWYCDGCGAILNSQEGFYHHYETWVCTRCGYKNDLSENNILK